MKYLKRFNESTSIFDVSIWKKNLPNELEILTNSGSWVLKKSDVNLLNENNIQISYYHNTPKEYIDGGVNHDGEPDYLEFDIHIVKENNGYFANSNILKLDIDITYGDAMMSEFSITTPNKVDVIHYTGKGSLYDPESFFGFSDKSLSDLISFFNRFGFKLTEKDLLFIDKTNDEYKPN